MHQDVGAVPWQASVATCGWDKDEISVFRRFFKWLGDW